MIQIKSIDDKAYLKYGEVLHGYDTAELLAKLEAATDKPAKGTIYAPGDAGLEGLPIAADLRDRAFGGMPVQIGYCNGDNSRLNCLEWHRGSEVNIPANDVVLLLAPRQAVECGKLDTSCVEAFYVPRGTVSLIYETTLHYAPCNAVCNGKVSDEGFRVAVVLPKGTNTEKPNIKALDEEDKYLWAANKWLLAHAESSEAKAGAFVGLVGANIDLRQ